MAALQIYNYSIVILPKHVNMLTSFAHNLKCKGLNFYRVKSSNSACWFVSCKARGHPNIVRERKDNCCSMHAPCRPYSSQRRAIPVHHRATWTTTTLEVEAANSKRMSRRTRERSQGRSRGRGQKRSEKKPLTTTSSWMSALFVFAIMSATLMRSAARRDAGFSFLSLRNTVEQAANHTHQQRDNHDPVAGVAIAPQRSTMTSSNIRQRIARSKLKRKIIWRQRHSRLVKRATRAALSPLPFRTGRQDVVRDHVGRIIEPASPRDVVDERAHMTAKAKVPKIGKKEDEKILRNNSNVGTEVKAAITPSSEPRNLNKTSKMKSEETFSRGSSENSRSSTDKINRTKKATKDGNKSVDFQGCTGGTQDGMIRGQNVTRVCYSVYKIMRLFGFASLTDSPAGSHAEWMGELTSRLAFEQPMFRYVGTDADANALAQARSSVSEAGVDGDFEVRDVEKGFSGATDVLLHWTELDDSPRNPHHNDYPRHIHSVLRSAKRANIGYAIIAQYPRFKDATPSYRNGKWVFLGNHTSESPFLFNDDVRGAVPVEGGTQSYLLYLTFYSLRSMSQLEG